MHPYRPLFVQDERRDPPTSELRGLAVLLVVLGFLRVAPAMMSSEPGGRETSTAVLMLAIGIAILAPSRRLWLRVRRLFRMRS